MNDALRDLAKRLGVPARILEVDENSEAALRERAMQAHETSLRQQLAVALLDGAVVPALERLIAEGTLPPVEGDVTLTDAQGNVLATRFVGAIKPDAIVVAGQQ